MLYSHNLVPLVTKPTRITDHTSTLIDHIYTNAPIYNTISGIALVDLTDHLPVFCICNTSICKKKQKTYYRDYSTFSKELYLADMNSIDWQIIYNNSHDLHELTYKYINKVKEVINKHVPMYIHVHITYTKQIDIAEQFNHHFINVGPDLASLIDNTGHNDPIKYIKNSPKNSFYLSPINEDYITCLFSNLDEKKASLDIPNKLIKIASRVLSKHFTFICNQSIIQGIVPNILKISRVTPVFKNGITTDPANYRPIAILSPFSKILEKIVSEQLNSFIKKYNILFQYQFGFRRDYSTELAILEMSDNLKL